ncbi:MAG: FAD-binding oxidoreductase [Sulfuricurvum sp.]|uniref:NAD(P)/FAD-dependent oxidoreductase n=1 Tax=Sulfuricurvum sp. TaxID=2025608 RepID=UPI0025DD2918|nr:FAD-binding oxidoreductase [Sulfuricurvum sp.]MBV5321582.1 FAD-binding oxidoreductase [Sulfuricurvum sp.]
MLRFIRLPISKISPYDVIIIGAGINGCCSAYTLAQAGLNVALIDQDGIASGGSGAAGAFISPKISKAGELKEIMGEAHAEALEFYTTHFPQFTLTKPLLHIANSPQESEKLDHFKRETSLHHSVIDDELYTLLTPEASEDSYIYFSEGAVVDAQGVCNAMAEGIDFYPLKVEKLIHNDDIWQVGDLHTRHLILAIGAYPKLLPIDYVGLRGIWGHRIDIETSTHIPCILHHHVSISPITQEGIVAIGATHDVHYSPFSGEVYDVEQGREILLDKASKTLKLNNINILKDYTGLRSGSNDYLPMLGSLVNAEETLKKYPHIRHGEKIDPSEYIYYPNVTMINGSGGYGFVLAPYLAKQLNEFIIKGKPIAPILSPSRFFPRWAKRK